MTTPTPSHSYMSAALWLALVIGFVVAMCVFGGMPGELGPIPDVLR